MKKQSILVLILSISALLIVSACSNPVTQIDASAPSTGQIYLYGESHGVKKILEKEFELWYDYYHNQNMRHLFVELPYYTAEFLNLWMQSDTNELLDAVYNEWVGAATHTPDVKAFYEKIKKECPETIFHGTDIGHQYKTTGVRFLDYLKLNNLENSETYLLAEEAIAQGKHYYEKSDTVYRENMMVTNFIREFDQLKGESIMGIYGAMHTDTNGMEYPTQSVPCMANQLQKRYGDTLYTEDLSVWAKDIEPYRVDTIRVNGKDYKASYFGEQDLTGFKDYTSRAFWRLENAYDDFKDNPKQYVLPYSEYPMLIETGQVFVIDLTKIDGSVIREYYISNGHIWDNRPSTQGIIVE